MTLKEFNDVLNLDDDQKKLLGYILEKFITKSRRPPDDQYAYHHGQMDAFNSLWKLVRGYEDDYCDKIFEFEGDGDG